MSARKRHPVAPAPERFREAMAHRAAEEVTGPGIRYVRLREDYHGIPRGALMVEGRVVPDYPHIARVFALGSGIRHAFEGRFQVEEKIDGYNVRIFRAGGRIVAVTRSGRICPFTTDRLPDLLALETAERLFAEHPELILCAEIAGPGNPYMDSASVRCRDDVRLFVFDLLRYGQQSFVPLPERNAILERHPLPVAPHLGWFTAADVPQLLELIRELDVAGAEGIVMKPPGDGPRLKYVTPGINVQDVATEAALEMELPGEFYTHRIVRMVMALRELGQRERTAALGEAFGRALATGFDRALDEVERSEVLAKPYRVRLRQEAAADALLEHLNQGSRTIRVEETAREWDGTHWVLSFRKIFRRSTSRLGTLMAGGPIVD